jgi:hypothetical protein
MGPVLSNIHVNKQAKYNYKYVDTNGEVYVGTKEGRLTKVQNATTTTNTIDNTTTTNITSTITNDVILADSANLDAFSRLRVSNPLILFNSQLTYDLAPILLEQLVSGLGATITHDATNRCALMTFSSTPTGGKAYMQSFEYLPYQPGRSQLIFVTFNMIEAVTNVLKFAGYSDGNNGIEFQVNGGINQFTLYSDTTLGDETVVQADWNLDPLDGTGLSGVTLDIARTQILVIDIQALYAGRVRVGFDIGGSIVYCHEFLHANLSAYPYIQTANLPVRCGMTCTNTVSTTMNFICSAVISEGGTEDINVFGYTFQQDTGAVSVGTGGTHMLSLRPKTTFNGKPNRTRVAYIDVEVYNAGNQPVQWQLCLGQAISGTTTYNNVNTTYSSSEYNVAGTLSGSPSIIIDGGYIASSGSAKAVTNTAIVSRYPITLNQAGAVRSLGTLTLKATSLSGTQICYASIKFREIR